VRGGAKAPCRRAPLWSDLEWARGDVGLKPLRLPRAPIFPLPGNPLGRLPVPLGSKSPTGGRLARGGQGNPKFGMPVGVFAHGGGFWWFSWGFWGFSCVFSPAFVLCHVYECWGRLRRRFLPCTCTAHLSPDPPQKTHYFGKSERKSGDQRTGLVR